MSEDKPRVRMTPEGGYRLDAWRNNASGMGVQGIDKSTYTRFDFYGSKIDWKTLSLLYRYDWLARKICDRPANDAVRRWINIDSPQAKAINAQLESLHAKKRIKQGVSWGRLYGGAAILLIVDDGMTPADPLNPAKVKRIVDLKTIDRHNLQPKGRVEDVYDVRYGEPEHYTTNNGTVFHHTRVLKFTGADLTQDEAETEEYWGGSYIELYQQAVKSFQGSMQDVRHIMTESSISALKVPGLTQSVAMGGTIFDAIQKRLDQFNLSKSLYRTAAMDAEESHEFHNRTLTGLSDLLDRFMTQAAGATDMGELVLFGTSPNGLNASQEEQMAMYYDVVASIQEDDMMHAINTILLCITKGKPVEWEYAPLMAPTDLQKAEMREKEANAINTIAEVAMLEPGDVIEHLNSTGHFNLALPASIDDGDA